MTMRTHPLRRRWSQIEKMVTRGRGDLSLHELQSHEMAQILLENSFGQSPLTGWTAMISDDLDYP
jgi:hypothetical protein